MGRGVPTQPASNQQLPRRPVGSPRPPPKGGERGGRGGGGHGNMGNPYKKWNSWNACYSSGVDVPRWHTIRMCPWEFRKDHHQEAYTRGDYDTHVQAGWLPSRVGNTRSICRSQARNMANDWQARGVVIIIIAFYVKTRTNTPRNPPLMIFQKIGKMT